MKRTPIRTWSIELQRDWEERTREKARTRRQRAQREGLSPRRVRALPKRGRKYVEKRARDFGGKAAWVRTLPCLVCGKTPSDPHHEPPRSLGGTAKGLVPLCRGHHSTRHELGARLFKDFYGTDLVAVAARLEGEWAA